ncbi:MAG TPA: hypothetical protein PKO16_01555 [Bacteroidia bacterium]|nr:hypothetical protein [Bacteroidia bacterium]
MGIERRGEGGLPKKFVNVFNGKFEIRVDALDKNNPSIIKRTTTTGKELIVDQFEAISGHIEGLEYVKESKVGKRLLLKIASDKLYIIDIPYIGTKNWVSEYARSLLNRLDNIDLDMEVRVAPYSFIPKEKTRKTEGFSITQKGEKVEPIDYELVPRVEKKEGLEPGEIVYDPSEQTKWYHSLMLKQVEKISDYMGGKKSYFSSNEEYPTGGIAGAGMHVDTSNIPVLSVDMPEMEDDFEDDLPF